MLIRALSVVGRENEVAVLVRALASARTGRGGATFVVGEAGIGKTRLVSEVAGIASSQQMIVLRGRGSTIGPMVPYRPITEALLSLFRGQQLPADNSLGPYRAVLGQLVPEWRDEAAYGAASPIILAEAILRLTAAVGRAHGCLLVLDDLQDADAETLAVVDYMIDNLDQQPTMLLVTIRAEPSDALAMAEGATKRFAAGFQVLDRLGRDDMARMIGSCLGVEPGDVPTPVLEEMWESSAGLPFVIEELLHAMVSGGYLIRGPEGWTAVGTQRPAVPPSLVRHLTARIEQLGPPGRLVLSAAAVLGRRFSLSVLQRAVDLDDHTLLNTLRAAVAAQLVAPDDITPDWYTFRHPLTAEGLLAQLIPAEYAAICRQVADAIEALHPGLPGEWCAMTAALRLDSGDTLTAVRLFVEAGRRALAGGAVSSAVALLERADKLLAEHGDVDVSAEVLEVLVPALGEAGQFDQALRRSDTIEQLVRNGLAPGRAADLYTRLARVACLAGRAPAADAHLSAARALLGPEPGAEHTAGIDAVAALVALVMAGPDHIAVATDLARRAVVAAESVPLPEIAFDAWQALGLVARVHDLSASTAHFDRARLVAEQYQLSTARAYALLRLGGNSWLADGDTVGLARARSEATRQGLVVMVYNVDANLALHTVLDGRFNDAAELLDQCWTSVSRLRLTIICRHLLITRATGYAHQGRRREMDEALAEFRRWGGDEAPERALAYGLARAYCALMEEDRDLAREELTQAGVAQADNPTAYHLAGGHGLALLLDVLERAAGWPEYDELTKTAASRMRWNRQYVLLAKAVLLGRDGRHAEAEVALAEARRVASRYGMARHLGVRLVAPDAWTHGWGDCEAALRDAEEYFHAAGMITVASACRATLRQIGASVRQRRHGTDRVPPVLRARGVTIREYEVFELLEWRLTNKAIAGRLHISPRTVEKHIASLMMKTERPDRAALIEYVAELRSTD